MRVNNGSGSKTLWKNDEHGQLDDVSSPSLHSPPSATTSPSTMLLPQSAKIAAQAATSIIKLVESMSARVNNNNVSDLNVNGQQSNTADEMKKMNKLSEHQQHRKDDYDNNRWDTSLLMCGHDNHCFRHFEYCLS
jgi:hypothetical protein